MSATVTVLAPSPTPATYHRIISSTLTISNEPTVPVPVGILACQRDPLLRSLTTVVVQAHPAPAPPPPPAGKKQKKPANPTTSAPSKSGELWEVILHDTVLFPEGGGQPSDVGLMTKEDEAGEEGKHWEVEEARRKGGIAVHYVRLPEGASLSAGDRVRVWLGEKGEERRIDHMSMHTAQHVLSALLESRLQLPTLSWSMTAFPTPAYVELPRMPTPSELEAITKESHALARANAAVHVEVAELNAENRKVVDVVDVAGKGREVGRGLPSDYTGGVNRVVVIDGVDRNPCCGTHLPSLSSLELFLLPASATSTGTSTTAKLQFLAGPRLHAHLASTHTQLSQAAQLLSCGPALVPERLEQALDERRRADKRGDALMHELAGFIAGSLNPRGAYVPRVDEGSGSALLNAVAGRWETVDGALAVLVASPAIQTATSTSFVSLVGFDEGEVKKMGEALKALGIKGGGRGKRWSGKFTGVWLDKREGEGVKAALQEIAGA